MPLRHLHLHHTRLPGPPDRPLYDVAVKVQSHFQDLLRDYKAAAAAASSSSPSSQSTTASSQLPPPPPPPTLISFTPQPTYTLGRRQTTPLTPADERRLRAPLRVWYNDRDRDRDTDVSRSEVLHPTVTYAPRGGLTTYHGPGQLVLWPVVDLHSPLHRHFTVREYACLLEQTTIAALGRLGIKRSRGRGEGRRLGKLTGSIRGFTTVDPGVWVRHDSVGIWPREMSRPGEEDVGEGSSTTAAEEEEEKEERKIAAMGVHLRRHVTGLGVAINVSSAVAGPEETNPWARIVACGLEGKRVTSVGAELMGDAERTKGSPVLEELEYALRRVWAREFAGRLFGTAAPISVAGADSPYYRWDQRQTDRGLWLPNTEPEEASSSSSAAAATGGVMEATAEETTSVVRMIEDHIIVSGEPADIERTKEKKRAEQRREMLEINRLRETKKW